MSKLRKEVLRQRAALSAAGGDDSLWAELAGDNLDDGVRDRWIDAERNGDRMSAFVGHVVERDRLLVYEAHDDLGERQGEAMVRSLSLQDAGRSGTFMQGAHIMANDEYFKLLLRYVADTCE